MTNLRILTGWRNTIARRVQEREVRRQMLYNRGRKITHKYLTRLAPKHPTTLGGEFLRMWLGSLAAFWIIARLLAYLPHVNSEIVLLLFGLLFSMQASYYKSKLSRDPNYKIPKCGTCGGRKDDNTETVLRSSDSALLGIPNSWLGVGFYVALLVITFMTYPTAAIYLAGAGILASAFLSYVMIAKIKALCALCVNTAALNLLIFLQIWFRLHGGAHHL
jgi:uncharacterized membrane protein